MVDDVVRDNISLFKCLNIGVNCGGYILFKSSNTYLWFNKTSNYVSFKNIMGKQLHCCGTDKINKCTGYWLEGCYQINDSGIRYTDIYVILDNIFPYTLFSPHGDIYIIDNTELKNVSFDVRQKILSRVRSHEYYMLKEKIDDLFQCIDRSFIPENKELMLSIIGEHIFNSSNNEHHVGVQFNNESIPKNNSSVKYHNHGTSSEYPSNTSTNTFTNTSINTSANTSTNTFTNTSINTSTNTFTNTSINTPQHVSDIVFSVPYDML